MRTTTLSAADAVTELRRAAEAVARFAPPGFARDLTDIERRIGLMVAALAEHDMDGACRRCGQVFTYSATKFARLKLDPPRHCYDCRQARRRERASAGLPRGILCRDE